MPHYPDIRDSLVIQERTILAERLGQAVEELSPWKAQTLRKLAASKISPDKIAYILELDVDLVHKELAKNPS
jgi:hypothetical protein